MDSVFLGGSDLAGVVPLLVALVLPERRSLAVLHGPDVDREAFGFRAFEERVRDEHDVRTDGGTAFGKVGPEPPFGPVRHPVVVEARRDPGLDLADAAERVGREGKDEGLLEERELHEQCRDYFNFKDYEKAADIANRVLISPEYKNNREVLEEMYYILNECGEELAEQIQRDQRTDRREANTQVIVRDGETMVIGGVFIDTQNNNVQGVPYLSRIPVLGWLFKNKSESVSKQELLIFLTPSIVQA